jgi:DNA-binding transcriptional MocR family regulator
MVKRAGNIMLEVAVNFSANIPLHRQLYMSIKGLILDGRLRPGSRLPSTRTIADDLKLSRTTVLNAYEQLSLEGYLEGETGRLAGLGQDVPPATVPVRDEWKRTGQRVIIGGKSTARKGFVKCNCCCFVSGTMRAI